MSFSTETGLSRAAGREELQVRRSLVLPFLRRAFFALPTGLTGRRRVAAPAAERTTFFTPLPRKGHGACIGERRGARLAVRRTARLR
jgi:hypothetical protein